MIKLDDNGAILIDGVVSGYAAFMRKDVSDTLRIRLEAANDALDEIEALVKYNEENNLYATKTYRDVVDILIRAGRR